jgi:hypothetical protein
MSLVSNPFAATLYGAIYPISTCLRSRSVKLSLTGRDTLKADAGLARL